MTDLQKHIEWMRQQAAEAKQTASRARNGRAFREWNGRANAFEMVAKELEEEFGDG